jgi:3-hydroxyisobutyrate dehydrogenase-like beta-hydroxyacid dehydrogenase
MQKENVGILHPGQMGISIAATMQNTGHTVYWASEGRSAQSRQRAEQFNLLDAGTLRSLAQTCLLLVSVCPPDAAEALSGQVIEAGFKGLYIDANAISPGRAVRMAAVMEAGGNDFVDGGIIGGPAWEAGSTWLYLSGPRAEKAAAYFEGGPLGTRVIGEEVGKASALKMCFAAYTKGSRAMLTAILATAARLNVLEDLKRQWGEEFFDSNVNGTVGVTRRAWRFAGEMDEIAATFRQAGLPGGFHEAASELYRRLAQFKDADAKPSFEDVLQALLPESGTQAGL